MLSSSFSSPDSDENYLKQTESDTNNLASRSINEQYEWVREHLTNLWGPNKADYFVNPSRIVKQTDDLDKDEQIKKQNSINLTKKSQRTGLFAYAIWDSLREDSNHRLKIFDLNKELQQTMDKFSRSYSNRNINSFSIDDEDDEVNRLQKGIDAKRMRHAKILRNEIELMYRSSKMNEERVNVLRANSPMPDLNDNHGNDSIVKYLPPIINIDTDFKAHKQNPSLELMKLPITSNSLSKKKTDRSGKQNEYINCTLFDLKTSNKNKPRLETQNVRLHFLSGNNNNNQHTEDNSSKSNKRLTQETLSHSTTTTTTSNSEIDHKSSFALVPSTKENIPSRTQSPKSAAYPPLTINALMEYRPLISAPGTGEFDNGRPKLFKID